MIVRLAAGAAVLALMAGLSGCIIISSEGGSRTVVASAGADGAMGVPSYAGLYADAVADPKRPAEEVAPGDKVADIRPGAGYFTRLFSDVVGPNGRVYAFVPNRTMARENPTADLLVAAYPNVTRVNGLLDAMTYPEPLDVVFMSQEYHDFHIPRFGVDVTKMNADIFKALKPGGLFVVIDHQAASGAGNTVVETLHRIEGAQLRREVEAAGFVFDGETSAVANPADNHTLNVFDEAIRGKTDQFVYRFRKPG